ncbi:MULTISPECIES: extracellular solute-binding protein [unclassified Thalassospira]|jgi:spermidine/putrescine transport system substrate-binding protein|uniref:extracellular solute-binding protein n=1 Tax=unclassified Thalassospira TaxID=2648997 RepID=UPI000A1EB88B|nr:extracellular solute-binding protein [Thalassospira sp. MCCC 1A01428]OSQ41239.1 spermidine/putrescine ABC transporter substrate-binding protein [Thalassospira sp. MCCC 1A01428]
MSKNTGSLRATMFGVSALAGVMMLAGTAQAEELRLLTWGGYAPDDVIQMFEKETGIDVEVTLSNNEDMISKLRATGGGGFDLAQPSQDRIAGAQMEYGIYKPMDLSKVDAAQFIPSMLAATKTNTTVDGKVYGLPHIWGTSGLVVDTKKAADVKDYTDLCNDSVAGKVSYRLKRPTLIGFAFAMGMDPFAAYTDEAKYQEILDKVQEKLIECKPNVKTYWEGGDALLNLVRSGEVVAAMAWDTGGWKLNNDNADITFVAPKSGALGWVDTFALPRKSENEDAAYKWINFVMQPEIAAKITASAGNFTASKGADDFAEDKLKAQFKNSFPQEALDNIKWYPPVPAGLETLEGKALDRVKAAQ